MKNIFKSVSGEKLDTIAKQLSKMIKLDKPLVIFNIKTTGWSISKDKIIEIAYVKVWEDSRIKKDDILLNPEIKISEELTEIHGIKDEELTKYPTFKDRAQELWDTFNNCSYGGFDILDFDLQILRREFLRVGMDFNYSTSNIIDSRVIYRHMEPRTLSGTYRFYCGNKYTLKMHGALTDVKAITEILEKQLMSYKEARDWDFVFRSRNIQIRKHKDVFRKFYWRKSEAHFAFSKYKDMPLSKVAQIDPGFLRWMLGADFSEETKNIVGFALRKTPKRRYANN